MRRVLALMLFVSCSGVVRAQSTNASLSGRVTDPTGGIIVGAKVAAINTGTNFRYEAATNGAGEYYLTNLPPGSYRIEIEKSGFKKLIKPDVILHVQDALAIDFEMALGSASETITVEAGAPLVNTESATVSTVVDRTFVENIPLNGRSFQTLDHAHAGRGGDRHGFRRPGTVQREWAARGCQLFHRGWGQRQFRRHRLHSSGADRRRERCPRSALWAGPTAWCRWMPCRSFASRLLRLLPSSDAPRADRSRL